LVNKKNDSLLFSFFCEVCSFLEVPYISPREKFNVLTQQDQRGLNISLFMAKNCKINSNLIMTYLELLTKLLEDHSLTDEDRYLLLMQQTNQGLDLSQLLQNNKEALQIYQKLKKQFLNSDFFEFESFNPNNNNMSNSYSKQGSTNSTPLINKNNQSELMTDDAPKYTEKWSKSRKTTYKSEQPNSQLSNKFDPLIYSQTFSQKTNQNNSSFYQTTNQSNNLTPPLGVTTTLQTLLDERNNSRNPELSESRKQVVESKGGSELLPKNNTIYDDLVKLTELKADEGKIHLQQLLEREKTQPSNLFSQLLILLKKPSISGSAKLNILTH
jgi:hypothetical protein